MSNICGDGMCPYVPCKDYPKCKHIEEITSNSNKTPKEVKNGRRKRSKT